MKFYLVLFSIALLSGCASYIAQDKMMGDPSYNRKPVMTRSLLDGENLTEDAIQKILNSRIKIPTPARIGIVRLVNNTATAYAGSWGYIGKTNLADMNDSFVAGFYKTLDSSNKVRSVIPIPRSLISDTPSLKSLRLAAVVVQADLLLVINSDTDSNWDFKWLEAQHTARGVSKVEAYLLDTRTGIIPITGVYADSAEIKYEGSKDYDLSETMRRARLESETKVFAQLAKDVVRFIEASK